jgi:L-2-hydroxyglutarate oxidase
MNDRMGGKADVVIAGGGIVGLATAWRLLQGHPDRKVIVLEKEAGVARHQTGHNSGVIHSGIYYKPGSFKARLCRRGYAQMVEFCATRGIPHEICGKLVVALSESELPQLETLRQRAEANGLAGVRVLEAAAIAEHEPHAKGIRALHVPETGIVDYKRVAETLAAEIRSLGGEVVLASRVDALRTLPDAKVVRAGDREFTAAFFINCGGLMSDRLARLDGLDPGIAIVPFRGEYYELAPAARSLVRNLIYPVPDPAFPFLGVHFTRMIGGGVECGPNAVLAFKREGYRKTDFSAGDLSEVLLNPGFRKLAARHWRMGLGEFHRSFSKAAFVRALQRLLPAVRADMLTPAGAGVRAQALKRDGSLVDDFAFAPGTRSLHVLNAPSPAATASLAIGEEIVSRYSEMTRSPKT